MPKSTTATSDERNTIYHLVSDLEDDICNMEGYASLLQLAADGVASHHGQEAGDGLIRLAAETTACVGRLREWHRIAHAAVGGQDDAEPVKPVKPAEPAKSAEPTVYELCHQWDVVRAKLDLDVLECSGDAFEGIMDEARAKFRAIEHAILAADLDTLRDVDHVVMLRLARKVIGNDEFGDEQEERCHKMLDLIDGALTRRTEPGDWNRAA